jgi:cell division protein FtsI (penicillin-binding protein 3)
VIDEPSGKDYFGAKVAGPPFAKIVGETLRYLGVPPSPPRPGAVEAAPAAAPAEPAEPEPELASMPILEDDDEGDDAPLPEGMVRVPDFRDMGVAQALDAARERGLRVTVEGSGRAVEQEPPPGLAAVSSEVRIVFAR